MDTKNIPNPSTHLLTASNNKQQPKQNLTAASLIIQAVCIDVIGIISILSGVYLTLVILTMMSQGAYLIMDAHRSSSQK